MFKKIIDPSDQTIVISRTDSIGDVMLTLPICSYLKDTYPNVNIIFLGRAYTKAIIDSCKAIDEFYDWDEISRQNTSRQKEIFKSMHADIFIHVFPNKEIAKLAKAVNIKYRIGTSHRFFHFFTCNFRPAFSRMKSKLHEAQLNFKLLKPFYNTKVPKLSELNSKTDILKIESAHLTVRIEIKLKEEKKKIILHPKSQGSAIEWPIEKYINLSKKLVEKGYLVFFTGTEKEGLLFRKLIPKNPDIIDTTGLFSLQQLMYFISRCDAMVACSTGPLHIAGFLGKKAIGLYSPRIPIHPGRWKPLGKNATYIVFDKKCLKCAKGKKCNCISDIDEKKVLNKILKT